MRSAGSDPCNEPPAGRGGLGLVWPQARSPSRTPAVGAGIQPCTLLIRSMLGRVSPKSAGIGQLRPQFGPRSAPESVDSGQNTSNFGQALQPWPIPAKPGVADGGHFGPEIGRCQLLIGPPRPKFGGFLPNLAGAGRQWSKFERFRAWSQARLGRKPNFGQACVGFGPPLTISAELGRLLKKIRLAKPKNSRKRRSGTLMSLVASLRAEDAVALQPLRPTLEPRLVEAPRRAKRRRRADGGGRRRGRRLRVGGRRSQAAPGGEGHLPRGPGGHGLEEVHLGGDV